MAAGLWGTIIYERITGLCGCWLYVNYVVAENAKGLLKKIEQIDLAYFGIRN